VSFYLCVSLVWEEEEEEGKKGEVLF
jgi:hypothetical protein